MYKEREGSLSVRGLKILSVKELKGITKCSNIHLYV